jgi:hypothetical protein
MEKSFQPVIVVAAYNRPVSLKRILASLEKAIFKDPVTLIISIDNEEPDNLNIKEIAENFHWPHGSKEVRYQVNHLGLRKHILQCGDLSLEYGSVIILEDDLYVSPYFYEYAVQALDYYKNDERIGGISLYNQPVHEISEYPFSAIHDQSDVYFIQFPSSLGQAWTSSQWKEFRDWYANEPDLSEIGIPDRILQWPPSSWKKYFCGFLMNGDKYFVFPQFSFTTNFNDPGTNLKKSINYEGQTPLRLYGQPYRFRSISDSLCIYDMDMELTSACIDKRSDHLHEYSYELDLYGTKDLKRTKKPYVITSRLSSRPLKGFKRALKPHEMNIILNLQGQEFVLTRVEDVLPVNNRYERILSNYKYFYTRYILGSKTQVYYYLTRIRSKISDR